MRMILELNTVKDKEKQQYEYDIISISVKKVGLGF